VIVASFIRKVISRRITKFLTLLLIVLTQFFFVAPQTAYAATSPSLGNAAGFAVLAGTAITNVPTSIITGDVGLSPAAGSKITGLTNAEVSGTIFAPDATGPAGATGDNPSLLTSAKNDLVTAYNALSLAPNVNCTVDYGAVNTDLATLTLTPGIYCSNTFSLSGTLTLDDSGGAGGVWIFRSEATLITSPGSVAKVQFLGVNGSPCNVWWKVVSSATLDTGTEFIGNILALTSITMNTGATLKGRALTRNAAVTLDSNTITQTCSGLNSKVVPLTSAGAPAAAYCPPLDSQTVAPSVVESRRVNPTSIFVSWGPYSGTNSFNVRYGTTDNNFLYNTNVTGFSTTINNLPVNQPIWVSVAARNNCTIGDYGPAKLIGGPGLPNTGFAPQSNGIISFITGSFFALSSFLLKLIHI
jgi:hypothetical protein